MKTLDYTKLKHLLLVFAVAFPTIASALDAPKPKLPGGDKSWKLFWNDEFDYPNAALDLFWNSANGAQTWILCSRWRENAVVSDGNLKLQNRKESRGGQEWTSGSIWTKQLFQYGYYECRYKYAAATGTNNSFWFMSQSTPTVGKKFEIDINEGHFPSEMATNIHNWSDITTNPTTGKQTHPSASKAFKFATTPDVTIQLEIPITTRKVRLTSNYASHFHIQEFRIYNVNEAGYPSALSATADKDVAGLVNFARDASTKITSSGVYGTGYELPLVADGTLSKHWVSQTSGAKWLEFEFAADKTIGCIQFVSGWLSGTTYNAVLDDYKVQYYDGTEWVDMSTVDPSNAGVNFGRDYHYFGLKWTADSLGFYCDGKEMRRVKNDFCFSSAPLFLSEAIIAWAGTVTDAIDGTQMEVDYVRCYQPVDPKLPLNLITNGGFETLSGSMPANWEYNRLNAVNSAISNLTTGQAEGVRSVRVKNTADGTSNFSTNIAQKLAITSPGLYELRFKARVSGATANGGKIFAKFGNMVTLKSNFLDNSESVMAQLSADWQSYSFKINLNEDYSNKFALGISQTGTYDVDSLSLVRLGDFVISGVNTVPANTAQVYAVNQQLKVVSDTNQQLQICSPDGTVVAAMQVTAGEQLIPFNQTGLYIVRLRNKEGDVVRKLFFSK